MNMMEFDSVEMCTSLVNFYHMRILVGAGPTGSTKVNNV